MGFITIEFQGGLGNQLFQIYAILNLAKKFNMSPIFPDIDRLNNKRHIYYRELFPNLTISNNIPNFNWIRENDFGYKNITLDPDKNYKLYGYFQSAKYHDVLSIRDIWNTIKISNNDIRTINTIYDSLRSRKKTLIAVHIRRTDYLASTVHKVLPVKYYKKSMEIFKDIKKPLYLIFSDDKVWCKNNLKFFGNIKFIELDKDYLEIFLMSKCDHHIIANSSFSWWGAYLNEKSDKRVVCPAKWFNNNLNTRDLRPDEWIKVDW